MNIRSFTSKDGIDYVVFDSQGDCYDFMSRLGLDLPLACCDGYMNAFALPPSIKPARKYMVTGTVHYSDGFEKTVEAVDECKARAIVRDEVRGDYNEGYAGLNLDEICINDTTVSDE